MAPSDRCRAIALAGIQFLKEVEMQLSRLKAGLATSIVFLFSACRETVCVGPGFEGLEITVIDEATRGSPTAIPVVRATSDGLSFTLQRDLTSNPPRYTGGSRPGSYQLRIETPGYETLVKDNVVIREEGSCKNIVASRFTVSVKPISRSGRGAGKA